MLPWTMRIRILNSNRRPYATQINAMVADNKVFHMDHTHTQATKNVYGQLVD